MERDEFEARACERFKSEMQDVRKASRLIEAGYSSGRVDEARDKASEFCGEPLEVETVKVVRVLLGTGGPACGYDFWLDSDGGIDQAYYWYQDWFKEKRRFYLSRDQIASVVQAYDLYIEGYSD